jgi:hypothetical protein
LNGLDVITDPRSLDTITADCVGMLGVHCPVGDFISREAAICVAGHEGWIVPGWTRETAGLLFSNVWIEWSITTNYPVPVTPACPGPDDDDARVTDDVGCPLKYETLRVDALTGLSHGFYGDVGPTWQ